MKILFVRRPINPVYLSFMVVTFIVAVASALQIPTLSLFLTREVGVRPLQAGLFFTVNAIAGIVVSLLLAISSDRCGDRRRLILFCCVMALFNMLLFAFSRHYLTLITLGVLLSSLANVMIPQMFALAREYADRSAHEAVMFSTLMRAQFSLAWVIAPPMAFALALNYSFTTMFLIAAGLFMVSLLLVRFLLPGVPRVTSADAVQVEEAPCRIWKNGDVRILFIASVLMWTCNTMYIIDIPLYISGELGLPDSLAGLLMGTAAGLEIPAMLLAGWYVKRFGKRCLMLFAAAAGVVFYVGLVLFNSHSILIFLQLFNALFIGIVAGIGMIWFQDLLPGRAGAATTLFTNSISMGAILAGVLQGALVEMAGHGWVYRLAVVLALLAFMLVAWVRDV